MGNLDHVNTLESYIEELGTEITKVKKASDYLDQIEKMQFEITKTSATLLQSKDQIKLYQEILESKLELYHTIAKNIEAKQQMLEQAQGSIVEKVSELSKQYESMESLLEINKQALSGDIKQLQHQVSLKHDKISLELKEIVNQQSLQHSSMLSSNKLIKLSLSINASLMVIIILLILFLK